MSNNVLTHQMIAREAAAMLEELSPFTRNVNKSRQDEFVEAVNGYKGFQRLDQDPADWRGL